MRILYRLLKYDGRRTLVQNLPLIENTIGGGPTKMLYSSLEASIKAAKTIMIPEDHHHYIEPTLELLKAMRQVI